MCENTTFKFTPERFYITVLLLNIISYKNFMLTIPNTSELLQKSAPTTRF
jgi:hypothetical protein